MLGDLRYGLRLLRREPAFAGTAVLTLALGIGTATFLFGVADRVLLRPLPWPEPDRLIRAIETRAGRAGRIPNTISNGTYLAWSEAPGIIESIGAWREARVTVTGAGEAMRIDSGAATPSLFRVLRAAPVRGRLFEPGEMPGGVSTTVILSYGLWQERFGGSDTAIGRMIQIDGRAHEIVGVMPRDFAFPTRAVRLWTVWEIPTVESQGVRRGVIMHALARLKPGATVDQASAEGTARALAAPDAGDMAMALFGAVNPVAITARPAKAVLTAEIRPVLLVLMAAVALLLAVVTANVTSLQLARATTRTREMAVRAAVGADSRRLARHLLVENLAIGAAGCVAGLVLARVLGVVVPAAMLGSVPGLEEIGLDLRVAGFSVVVSLGASVICGLWPMLDVRRTNLIAPLGRESAGGGVSTRTARRRAVIMAGQVAVAAVLLIGTALLSRSLLALTRADRGYDPRNLITAQLPFPAGYAPERRQAVRDGIVSRLRATAGVATAACGFTLPFGSPGGFTSFKFRSPGGGDDIEAEALRRVVCPGYMEALRLRVVAGRPIGEQDVATAPPAIVVNTTFVRRFLGNISPADTLGLSLGRAGMAPKTDAVIIGVVDDMRQDAADAPPQAEIFVAASQLTFSLQGFSTYVVARTEGPPEDLAGTLRTLLREQDASLAFDSMMSMDERVSASLATPRAYILFLAAFAISALLVVNVGLFGVLSYLVTTRTRELALRSALGASPRQVVALVVRQAAGMTAVGTIAGLLVASAGATAVSKFVYGVAASDPDPLSFIAAPIGIAVAGLVACLLPARRAAAVDPVRVLRAE